MATQKNEAHKQAFAQLHAVQCTACSAGAVLHPFRTHRIPVVPHPAVGGSAFIQHSTVGHSRTYSTVQGLRSGVGQCTPM